VNTHPKIILRLGSHSEKEYFEKLAKSLDGMVFGANLLEITPAATSSLIFSLKTKRGGTPLPYFLDPMTYCFGPYVDPSSGRKQTDLAVLKSERAERRGSATKITAVKESYLSLAAQLGPTFSTATKDGRSCSAIEIGGVGASARDSLCGGVVNYQLNRIHDILADDEFLKDALANDGKPAAIFAPYFFIHESWAKSGLDSALDLAARTASLKPGIPVHVVICASHTLLDNRDFTMRLIDELPKTRVDGLWLWFDGFDEHNAPIERLLAFRGIVQGLQGKMQVLNSHGGYFSLLLAHDGLTGISHGVGYGEKKAVVQVQGAAAPTVRYYLPPINFRVGVPDVQRCFSELEIKTAADFFLNVCNCQICKV
jgi:hypothetical protein